MLLSPRSGLINKWLAELFGTGAARSSTSTASGGSSPSRACTSSPSSSSRSPGRWSGWTHAGGVGADLGGGAAHHHPPDHPAADAAQHRRGGAAGGPLLAGALRRPRRPGDGGRASSTSRPSSTRRSTPAAAGSGHPGGDDPVLDPGHRRRAHPLLPEPDPDGRAASRSLRGRACGRCCSKLRGLKYPAADLQRPLYRRHGASCPRSRSSWWRCSRPTGSASPLENMTPHNFKYILFDCEADPGRHLEQLLPLAGGGLRDDAGGHLDLLRHREDEGAGQVPAGVPGRCCPSRCPARSSRWA